MEISSALCPSIYDEHISRGKRSEGLRPTSVRDAVGFMFKITMSSGSKNAEEAAKYAKMYRTILKINAMPVVSTLAPRNKIYNAPWNLVCPSANPERHFTKRRCQ